MASQRESPFLEADTEPLVLRFISLFDIDFHVDQLILMTSPHREWTLPFRELVFDMKNRKLAQCLDTFAASGLIRHRGGGWWDIITKDHLGSLGECMCLICASSRDPTRRIKVAVFRAFISSMCLWAQMMDQPDEPASFLLLEQRQNLENAGTLARNWGASAGEKEFLQKILEELGSMGDTNF